MLDRPTKLQKYQTYIDGKWCDAASGKTVRDASIPIPASRGR